MTLLSGNHYHTMADGTTDSANHLPPYLDMVFASIDSDGYGEAGSIVMFTALPPLGWDRYTELDNTFPRGASAAGGSASNLPPYMNVIYGQRKDPAPSASVGSEQAVTSGGDGVTYTYLYSGDGEMIAETIGLTTTIYIGNIYEKKDQGGTITEKKLYYAGSLRVAVSTKVGAGSWEVNFLLSDHLGSTSITTDDNGDMVSEMRYSPWGAVRFAEGLSPTDFTYTGQFTKIDHFGLMYYKARWYDVSLGRFVQADTVIPGPGNPIAWDRFAYVMNNALRYIDPSGHECWDSGGNTYCTDDPDSYEELGLPPPVSPPPEELEEWELKIIALAVYAESSNGTYPESAMIKTALWLMNRLTSGLWDGEQYPIWSMLKGIQSALSVLYLGDFPLPKGFFEQGGWSSEDQLRTWVEDAWGKGLSGSNADGFNAALDATKSAYNNYWGKIETDIIYFSHQHSPVDHNTVEERFQWILNTVALRTDCDPNFSFSYYGAYYSYTQNYSILLIGSNDLICGTQGSCGPPWPPDTP